MGMSDTARRSRTDYAAWAKDMCDLLDAIELAIGDDDRVRKLLSGRFAIAEKHGLRVEFHGHTSGERH